MSVEELIKRAVSLEARMRVLEEIHHDEVVKMWREFDKARAKEK
jgi:hypothetical protein